MVIGLSALICILGLVLFLVAQGKVSRVGEIMFGVALFALLVSGDKIIKIIGG